MKKRILFVMMVLLGCAGQIKPVQAQTDAIEEEQGIIVSSTDEFYQAISRQVRDHKDVMYYDTYQGTLGADYQKILSEYEYYHNVDDLPESGSYLAYYLKHIEMVFYEGSFTEKRNLRIEVRLTYKYDKQDVDAYFQHMKELAAELKKESDYESVKAVHDYLIRNYDYDYLHQNYLDYEGYLTGKMVCQGYCMAAFILLAEMDIPVRIVVGASEDYEADSDHAWNVVKVDGYWYNMDVTWDDEGGYKPPDYRFFLKSDADFYKHTREGWYDYDREMALVSYSMPKTVTPGSLIPVAAVIVLVFVFVRNRVLNREKDNEM
ncbi:MAG: hypothetical protein NC347_01270 [Clostridium sp.]|nr:hypothetical protein [Clostridium sp.]